MDNWWTQEENPSNITCTDSELDGLLHRALSILVFAVPSDENAMSDTGLVRYKCFPYINLINIHSDGETVQ